MQTYIHYRRYSELKRLFKLITFNNLISISIGVDDKLSKHDLLLIFSRFNECRLEKLCWYKFNEVINDMMWSTINKLKHLQIDICAYEDYVIILHQLPCLRTFVIYELSMKNSTDKSTLDLSPTFCSLLKSLTINDTRMTTKELEYIVKLTPKLEYLLVECNKLRKFDSMFHASS